MADAVPPAAPDGRFDVRFDAAAGSFFYLDADAVRYDWQPLQQIWFTSLDQSAFDAVHKIDVAAATAAAAAATAIKKPPFRGAQTFAKKPKKHGAASRKNTSVYVSHLPADVSVAEVHDVFAKCGVIMTSLLDGCGETPRIKLYEEADGQLKGDALVTYLAPESVALALHLLDGSFFRPGDTQPISVQEAVFTADKNSAESAAERKKAPSAAEKRILKMHFDRMKKKLQWDAPMGSGPSSDDDLAGGCGKYADGKVVWLRNVFDKRELDDDPSIAFDLKQEIYEECTSKFGRVTNVKLYDAYEDGSMTVKFKSPIDAQKCIHALNGRWFDGRIIEAREYDGVSLRLNKTCVAEDEEALENKLPEDGDEEKRLEKFSAWIESRT